MTGRMAEWLRRGTQANAFDRRTFRALLMDLSSWVRIPLLSISFIFFGGESYLFQFTLILEGWYSVFWYLRCENKQSLLANKLAVSLSPLRISQPRKVSTQWQDLLSGRCTPKKSLSWSSSFHNPAVKTH